MLTCGDVWCAAVCLQRLLVGMSMQQQQQLRLHQQSSLQLLKGQSQLQQEVQRIRIVQYRNSSGGSSGTASATPAAAAAGQQSAPGVAETRAPPSGVSSTPSSSSSIPAHNGEKACRMHSSQFCLKVGTVETVPRMLHLWEQGWPVGGPGMVRTFPALSTVHMSGSGGAKQQYDLLKLGNRLISVTATANNISTEQAAEVIEKWRAGQTAVIKADGSIDSSSSSDGGSSSSTRVLPPLPEIAASMPKSGLMGLTALCKLARDLPAIKQLADAKKQKAGLAGAQASSARKRQRNAESAATENE